MRIVNPYQFSISHEVTKTIDFHPRRTSWVILDNVELRWTSIFARFGMKTSCEKCVHFFEIQVRFSVVRHSRKRAWSSAGTVFSNCLEVVRPNQVWVSDITYIRTHQGFLYLFLTMDVYSRKIVGYHVSRDLKARGAVQTLKNASKSLRPGDCVILHSDCGSQYASHEFASAVRSVSRSTSAALTISMTEQRHCYENAFAERLNGILKQEYALGLDFPDHKTCLRAISTAVRLYNDERPHGSLQNSTPSRVFLEHFSTVAEHALLQLKICS